MNPFVRINLSSVLSSVALAKVDALRRGILVSSLALAVVTFFGGCDRWQRSVEACKQAAHDGLTARKAFLAGALPESVRSAVPEDFYAYEGLRDWFRMPLVFPYQLEAVDSTLYFRLMRYNGKVSVRDPNKSSENVRDGVSPMTALSHLSFDRTMLLFKKEGVDEYGIFSFLDGGFASFATEAELWTSAQGRGFSGPKRLIPVATAFDNYWAFRKPWLFASTPKATTEVSK